MSKRDDPHGPVLPDACSAMYDGFRDKLRSIPARPPVGDTRDPDPCICGHDEDEHTLAGCDSYTPTWPRLVRCPCTEFQPDRIASDNPVPVDEAAVTDLLNTLGDTTQPQPTDDHTCYYIHTRTCGAEISDEARHGCYRDPGHTDYGRRTDDKHVCLCGEAWADTPQPTDEIVEAVAEAMADADDGIIYGLLTPEEADFYQRMARAAIAALDEAGCL